MKRNGVSSTLAMNCILVVLGMMLLTQFYTLLMKGYFTNSGWINFIEQFGHSIQAHSLRYHLIVMLTSTTPVSNFIVAAGLLLGAVAFFSLYARFYVSLLVSAGFFIAWILNWTYIGDWLYELLFPAIFALFAALGSRRLSFHPSPFFNQLGFSTRLTFFIVLILSVLLYYVTSISFVPGAQAQLIGIYSGVSFLIINMAIFLFSKSGQKQSLEADKSGLILRYLDFMILAIAAMLLTQVYFNHFTNLFDLDEFKDSLYYYSTHTNARWLSFPLKLAADYSVWILPVYIVFESALSIVLCLLIMRGPALLIAAGLFGVLSFSELGVSSTWPPTSSVLTWQWELLLATLVSFIIGVQKTIALKDNFTLKNIILGEPVGNYSYISLFYAVIAAIVLGFIVYLISIATVGSSADVLPIAQYSGISFAILMFILFITNKFRQ